MDASGRFVILWLISSPSFKAYKLPAESMIFKRLALVGGGLWLRWSITVTWWCLRKRHSSSKGKDCKLPCHSGCSAPPKGARSNKNLGLLLGVNPDYAQSHQLKRVSAVFSRSFRKGLLVWNSSAVEGIIMWLVPSLNLAMKNTCYLFQNHNITAANNSDVTGELASFIQTKWWV